MPIEEHCHGVVAHAAFKDRLVARAWVNVVVFVGVSHTSDVLAVSHFQQKPVRFGRAEQQFASLGRVAGANVF